jgi:hypothetical protein
MDIADRAGYRLPAHVPLGNRPLPASSQQLMSSQGINPSTVLQHAGFYYFLAGNCAVQRRRRFLQSVEYEVSTNYVNAHRKVTKMGKQEEMRKAMPNGETVGSSPALIHERKVNHADQIVDVSLPQSSCGSRRPR